MKRGPSPRDTEPVFHRLDRAPPDADTCLDRLCAAFAHHRPVWNWCRQCFTSDEEAETRRQANPRNAPADSFVRIYHEHPACSGGRETFLHWLPRGLELLLLDLDRDFSMLEAMIRLAPSRWSFEEQDAVRVVLGRAAIGWFGGSSPAPLQCSTDGKDPSGDGGVSEALVRALLAFRIDPFDLFAWLARTGGRRAYEALLDFAFTPRLTEDPVYFVLEDKADESTQHIALAALDRLARDVLSRIVAGHDRAMRLWTWAEHADPALAHDIAALETTWRGRLSRLSSAARATDRALITAAIG